MSSVYRFRGSLLLVAGLLVACGDDASVNDSGAGAGGKQGGAGGSSAGGSNQGGKGGQGGAQGGKGGQAGATCTEQSAKTGNDPDNCGVCGYGCLGGGCEQGVCKPVVVREGFPKNAQLLVDDTSLFFLHPTLKSLAMGPKEKLATDQILLDDGTSKDSLASAGDQLFWKEAPATVKQLAKEKDAVPSVALKIDHFGPDVAVDGSGIYFTTQYSLWVSAPGGSPGLLKEAPSQKTFSSPRLGPGVVFLQMGNVGTSTATQLVRVAKGSGELVVVADFEDNAYSYAAGAEHVAVARRPTGGDTALCAGEPAAEIWSFPLLGAKEDKKILATKLQNPRSMAADSKHVYWRNTCDGSVWRAAFGSTDAEPTPEKLFEGVSGANEGTLALDDESVFFSFQGKLYRLAKGSEGGVLPGPETGAGGAGGSGGSGQGGAGGAGGSTSVSVCCEASSDPGCADSKVESCVCSQDSYCCEYEWDSTCAGEVEEFGCASCGSGGSSGSGGSTGSGDCCSSISCGDASIQSCVCAQDGFCCGGEWDSICAKEVVTYGCGKCPGLCSSNEDCTDPNKNVCDLSTNKCTGPCQSDADCPSFFEPTCDVDSGKCVECLSSSDCTSSFAPVCDPVTNTCVGCVSDNDCSDPAEPFCNSSGSCGCTSDNDCPEGLPICSFGTCVECTQDSECPDAEAPLCSNSVCKPNAQGNCCESTSGIKGCLDKDIESCVCLDDPYCCNSSWDGVCAGEVESLGCGTCSGSGGSGGSGGSAGAGGGSGGDAGSGGNDACSHDVCTKGAPLSASCDACTAKICEQDKYCCQVAWNSTCVKRAEQIPECVCGGAGGDAGHGGDAGAGGDSGAGGSDAGAGGSDAGSGGSDAGSGGDAGASGDAGSGSSGQAGADAGAAGSN